MPSTSKKQHNFMAAIANSPAFAKKVGVPQSVGQDFSAADKGRKFAKGGDTMATKGMNPFKGKNMKSGAPARPSVNPRMAAALMAARRGGPSAPPPADMPMKKGSMPMKMGGMAKYATGGFVRAADGIAQKGKTKAKQIKMAGGGKC
jgi:hypothetical protein